MADRGRGPAANFVIEFCCHDCSAHASRINRKAIAGRRARWTARDAARRDPGTNHPRRGISDTGAQGKPRSKSFAQIMEPVRKHSGHVNEDEIVGLVERARGSKRAAKLFLAVKAGVSGDQAAQAVPESCWTRTCCWRGFDFGIICIATSCRFGFQRTRSCRCSFRPSCANSAASGFTQSSRYDFLN